MQVSWQVGRRHEYKIYKKNHPDILKDVINTFDLGFLGGEHKNTIQNKTSIDKKESKELEGSNRKWKRNTTKISL